MQIDCVLFVKVNHLSIFPCVFQMCSACSILCIIIIVDVVSSTHTTNSMSNYNFKAHILKTYFNRDLFPQLSKVNKSIQFF